MEKEIKEKEAELEKSNLKIAHFYQQLDKINRNISINSSKRDKAKEKEKRSVELTNYVSVDIIEENIQILKELNTLMQKQNDIEQKIVKEEQIKNILEQDIACLQNQQSENNTLSPSRISYRR